MNQNFVNGFYTLPAEYDGYVAFYNGKFYLIAPFGFGDPEFEDIDYENIVAKHIYEDFEKTFEDILDDLNFEGEVIEGWVLNCFGGFEEWPEDKDLKYNEITFK